MANNAWRAINKLLAVALCFAAGQAALAGNDGGVAEAASAPSRSKPAAVARQAIILPYRLLSLTTTTLVGTPIAMVRGMRKEVVAVAEEAAGERGRMPVAVALFNMGMPLGLLSGGCDGFFQGIENGFSEGFLDPFSKEAFSLGTRQP